VEEFLLSKTDVILPGITTHRPFQTFNPLCCSRVNCALPVIMYVFHSRNKIYITGTLFILLTWQHWN